MFTRIIESLIGPVRGTLPPPPPPSEPTNPLVGGATRVCEPKEEPHLRALVHLIGNDTTSFKLHTWPCGTGAEFHAHLSNYSVEVVRTEMIGKQDVHYSVGLRSGGALLTSLVSYGDLDTRQQLAPTAMQIFHELEQRRERILLIAKSFAPEWRTGNAHTLAAGIYLDRGFDRLPVLADALEDAGCEDSVVLGHCRTGVIGLHSAEDWVLQLVLNPENL